jgi:DNA invertase Pin-like site-specific DNA recombinase
METTITPEIVPSIRVALYMRVSTEGQLDWSSLEAQESELNQYVKAFHNKYSLDKDRHIFIDMAQSGQSDDRPEFNRLMECAERREFDLILVWKIDRFFRNLWKAIKHIEELDKHSVGIKSITQDFDTSTSFWRTIFNIMMAFAELESNLIKDRTIMGKSERAKQGKYVWGGIPPYGYYVDEERVLHVKDDEAKIIREIYDLFLNKKKTVNEISKYLTDKKYPIRSVRRKYKKPTKVHVMVNDTVADDEEKKDNYSYFWSSSFLYSILKNPMYYGEYYYWKTSVWVDGVPRELAQKRKEKIENKEKIYESDYQTRPLLTIPCPHILWETIEESKEISEKARIKLQEWRWVNKRWMNHYIFSGKIYSGLTGYRYTGYKNTKSKNISYRIHRDKTKSNYEQKEIKGNIWEREMVGKVMSFIKEMIDCPVEKLANLFNSYQESTDINVNRRELMEEARNKVEMLQGQKKLIYDDRLTRVISVEEYAERAAKISKEIDIYKAKEASINHLILISQQNMATARTLKEIFESFKSRIDNLTYEEECALCEIIVDKITLFADDETYLLNFSNEVYNVLKWDDNDSSASTGKKSNSPKPTKGWKWWNWGITPEWEILTPDYW